MFHPWRVLRGLTDVTLHWVAMPTRMGTSSGRDVWLDPRQLQAERRCTLTHELVHLERGTRWVDGREESAVDVEAARRLIDLPDLLRALQWAVSYDSRPARLASMAEELWVDVPTLEARLAHLSADEESWLRARI